MRTVVYNLFPLPSPSYPVNNSVCPAPQAFGQYALRHCFHAFPREAERYIFYLIGIHMEHMAKNRERRSASSEMFPGQARTRGQGVNELVELIGLPAAIELIRAKGGTSFSVPLGITLRGQEQRENWCRSSDREQATKLIGRYGARRCISHLPSGFVDTRDRNINLNVTNWPVKGFRTGAGVRARRAARALRSPDLAHFEEVRPGEAGYGGLRRRAPRIPLQREVLTSFNLPEASFRAW